MAEANESTDRTAEQQGTGENQFYIIKRGTITLTPADYSGTPPVAIGMAVIKDYPDIDSIGSNPAAYGFDVYHKPGAKTQASDFPYVSGGLDYAVLKCPYAFDSSALPASLGAVNCWIGYDDTAGLGLQIKLYVVHEASGTTGDSFASDLDQVFYYTIYSILP